MDTRDLIRDNLLRSETLVLARIEDMREHALVTPTRHGGCHTLWVLGHFPYIEMLVVRNFMLGETNPLADWEPVFDGAEVGLDPGIYPSFDFVLSKCREVRQGTLALLDTLSEADLDRASAHVPRGYERTFGTWRDCLQFAADHWYMHRGQLADARREAGIARMGP